MVTKEGVLGHPFSRHVAIWLFHSNLFRERKHRTWRTVVVSIASSPCRSNLYSKWLCLSRTCAWYSVQLWNLSQIPSEQYKATVNLLYVVRTLQSGLVQSTGNNTVLVMIFTHGTIWDGHSSHNLRWNVEILGFI